MAEKTAFITGASRGLGRAIALELARSGATVALTARNADLLGEVAKAVTDLGGKAIVFPADINDHDAISRAVDQTVDQLGRIDLLVNSAGIYEAKPFLQMAAADWQRMLDINLLGLVHCTQVCVRHMVGRKSGHVINLASIASRIGASFMTGYTATKHAVLGLTRSLAVELLGHGIAVNAICPGLVETDMGDVVLRELADNNGTTPEALRTRMLSMTPLGRFVTAEEIAEVVVSLASSRSPLIFTGQALDVNGARLLV